MARSLRLLTPPRVLTAAILAACLAPAMMVSPAAPRSPGRPAAYVRPARPAVGLGDIKSALLLRAVPLRRPSPLWWRLPAPVPHPPPSPPPVPHRAAPEVPAAQPSPPPAYACPVGALGAQGRVDEGVDYAGGGPVRALGSGVVTYASAGSGWPGGGFLAYRLTAGPRAGSYVYVAEDVSLEVSVGQSISAGQVIAQAYGGPDGIETGWAMPPGTMDEAAAWSHYTDGVPTAEGYDFQAVLAGIC